MIEEIVYPITTMEAAELGKSNDTAYLGGGTRLLSGLGLNYGQATRVLISLEKLSAAFIRREDERCQIGALTTFQELADSNDTPTLLKKAVVSTASRTMRNMASVGGAVSLWADDSVFVPALWALGARVHRAEGSNGVPIQECGECDPSALVYMISTGGPRTGDPRIGDPRTGGPRIGDLAYISRTSHSSKSLVVVATAVCTELRVCDPVIVVSDCAGSITRLSATEDAIGDVPLPDSLEIEELVSSELSPAADSYASVNYKRYIAGVLVADILHRIAGAHSGGGGAP